MGLLISTLAALVIAFVGSVPVAGPVAVLVLDRAMKGDRRGGLSLALGGAIVEAAYAFGAALLFPAVVARSGTLILATRGIGSALIGIFGLVLVIHPSVLRRVDDRSKKRNFAVGVTLAALNPTLVATWLVVAGTLYAHGVLGRSPLQAVLFGGGVFLGIFGWFALVLRFSAWAERLLGGTRRVRITQFIGAVLVATGAYLAARCAVDWKNRVPVEVSADGRGGPEEALDAPSSTRRLAMSSRVSPVSGRTPGAGCRERCSAGSPNTPCVSLTYPCS